MSNTKREQAADFIAKIAGYLASGADQEALVVVEASLQDEDCKTEAACALAAIYYRAGAIGYAIKILAALADQQEHPTDLPEILSVLYAQAGCLSDALYYAKLSTTENVDRSIMALFGGDFPRFSDALAQVRPKPLLASTLSLMSGGQLDQALFQVEQHLCLLPTDVEALDIHAQIMILMGRNNEAIGLLRTVATLAGPSATLLSRLAGCLVRAGQFLEGLACHREAIARAPNSLPVLGAAMADLAFFAPEDAQASGIIAPWLAELAKSAPRTVRPAPKYTGASPVRICYLCSSLDDPDLKSMIGAIAHSHDRSRVSIVGFGRGEMDSPRNDWARGAFDLWRDVSNLDVTTMGALIRGEGVHVVIDADGSLAPSKRGLFQRNTAPLQVSWLNSEVAGRVPGNYLLAVPGAEGGEGELPLIAGRYCLGDVLGRAPTSLPTPAEAAGTITFGAELTRSELNSRLAMVWGRILQAVPHSVLLLRDSGMFDDSANVDALVSLFGNAGVAHRIEVVRQAGRAEFAASVDVALMPFPAANIPAYAEFLRLGVPVVALRSSHSGSDMAAFLIAAGLGEQLAGDDVDGYVAAATALASDIPALSALRSRLPEAISSVPAFSPKGFARMIEDAVIAALNSTLA